jgi:hypothetical protein
MMRRFILLALLAAGCAWPAEFVQAVEFPYYHHPRGLWERELVWLKNIGIRTVAFSGSPNTPPSDPRADLAGFLHILRRLGMRAWIYGGSGELLSALEPQLEKHGGPIAFIEGPSNLDAPPPPAPITRLPATAPASLLRSRQAFAGGHGSLLWQEVEDTLEPTLRRGVVSFSGDERPGSASLRRNAALLQNWAAILPGLQTERKLPGKISALQLLSAGPRGPSAVLISNRGASTLSGPLHVYDPSAARQLIIPKVEIPAGENLWLPVNIPLAGGGLCQDCAAFAPGDRIVYATAELHSIEFENGILACEFSAPAAGEVVIQLSRTPSGPLIAGGHPADFEWDAKNSAVRLAIPAGKGALSRVRIGLATEPPESSAFFGGPARLMIGQANIVSTSYSSETLASRSRLLAPPAYRLKAIPKSPLEIDYEVTVPADAPREATHGEFVTLALEADGVRLGRTRIQLFRPASVRLREAVSLHLGPEAVAPLEPPLVTFDPKAGRELHVAIRNNYASIQNYVVELSGQGLTFLPARSEVSIAVSAEREIAVRVFADDSSSSLREAIIRISGAADLEQRFQALALGRGAAVAYARDLDGDGVEDRIIENQRVRASFSGADGRWMEWVWKDSNTNLLPESGMWAGSGLGNAQISARAIGTGWELQTSRGRRTISLGPDNRLTVEQDQPLPAEILKPGKRDGVSYTVERLAPNRASYLLERAQ